MFDDFELSPRSGRPRGLFLFTRQGKAWRFASGDTDLVIGGNTYVRAPISITEIKETVEKPQDQVTITMPYMSDPGAGELPPTQDLGANWHPYVPSDVIRVAYMEVHANDPDLQAIIRWQGRVAQPKFSKGQLELTCIPSGTKGAKLRQGPKWGRSCWKDPYSTGLRGCNLDPADFQISATLTAVSGLVVTAAEFASAPLSLRGAALSWTREDGIVESRPVMSQSGADLTLLYGAADLAAGLEVTVLPDCPGNWSACDERNNTINYGGSVYEPTEDAFSGQSMSWG